MSADAADESDDPSDEALRERARRYRREARAHHPAGDPAVSDGASAGCDGGAADRDDAPRFAVPADYLRDGFGPVVSLYVESRTGGRYVDFTPEEYAGIEAAMNHWLACYAHARDDDVHYDEMEPDYAVREAATLLVDTHSARHAADVLMDLRG
jgi:hypothetical protein